MGTIALGLLNLTVSPSPDADRHTLVERTARRRPHGQVKPAAVEQNCAKVPEPQAAERTCARGSEDPVVETLIRLASALECLAPVDVQMIAARGEDVGDFIASLIAVDLITDVRGIPADPFETDRG